MIQALQKAGMDAVVLGAEQSKHGAVETYAADFSTVAPVIHEAASRYLGWDMYAHQATEGC